MHKGNKRVFLMIWVIFFSAVVVAKCGWSEDGGWPTSIITKSNAEITGWEYGSMDVPWGILPDLNISAIPRTSLLVEGRGGNSDNFEGGVRDGYYFKLRPWKFKNGVDISFGGVFFQSPTDGYGIGVLNSGFIVVDIGPKNLRFSNGLELFTWKDKSILKPYWGVVFRPSEVFSLLFELRSYNSSGISDILMPAMSPSVGGRVFFLPTFAIEGGIMFIPEKREDGRIAYRSSFFSGISIGRKREK